MRTNIFAYVLSSEARQKIVKALFQYPNRQWSCSHMEDVTKLSHATVFRTMRALRELGLLRGHLVNKRDFVYFLIQDSSIAKKVIKIIDLEQNSYREIAFDLVKLVSKKDVISILLYGSVAKKKATYRSDVDLLIVLPKRNKRLEQSIHDLAGDISIKHNKPISVLFVDQKEIQEKTQFTNSVQENHEVLYGKNPFRSG